MIIIKNIKIVIFIIFSANNILMNIIVGLKVRVNS